MKVLGIGPQPARLMIVGEAPGKDEDESGLPFIGASGLLLTQMLNEVGIDRSETYVTNAVKHRPPKNRIADWIDVRKTQPPGFIRSPVYNAWVHPLVAEGVAELESEIAACRPNLILTLGNTPLTAVSGNTGITKWRGSLFQSRAVGAEQRTYKSIAAIHPASILRDYSQRFITIHDLRRTRNELEFPELHAPQFHFQIRPSFSEVVSRIHELLARANRGELVEISGDIETRQSEIACIGFSTSSRDAISIPFLAREVPSGYWSAEEELQLVLLLRTFLTHPNVHVTWQNGMFDVQFIIRQWLFYPNFNRDTMYLQHVMWPGTPKDLNYISSLYSENHIFWKDEGKEMNLKHEPEDNWWIYNAKDCVSQLECGQTMTKVYESMKFKATEYGDPLSIVHRMHEHMLRAMLRGIRWDTKEAGRLLFDLGEVRGNMERYINTAVGRPLNTNSPKQLQELFYEEMGVHKILHQKTKKPTVDEKALEKIGKENILLRPICDLINTVRQVRVSQSVILAPRDFDDRFHCSFNVAGTETFRFSSQKTPFGFGTNGQNISAGTPEGERNKVLFMLPNLRKLFLPDIDYTWGDFDLPQADARVVAWDAEDEELMAMFADKSVDLHSENAKAIFGPKPYITVDGKSIHPDRYKAKQGVHAVNYLAEKYMLAHTLGITVHEADTFIKRWFEAHPKIRKWHTRIINEISTRRYIENAYGFRRYYFDRIESIIKEAIAWIPQSTTAITINLGIDKVCSDPELVRENVHLLLQVHDSADFQWPTRRSAVLVPKILERMTIPVPYPKPLIMPPGVKTSTKSWGDCA